MTDITPDELLEAIDAGDDVHEAISASVILTQ